MLRKKEISHDTAGWVLLAVLVLGFSWTPTAEATVEPAQTTGAESPVPAGSEPQSTEETPPPEEEIPERDSDVLNLRYEPTPWWLDALETLRRLTAPLFEKNTR